MLKVCSLDRGSEETDQLPIKFIFGPGGSVVENSPASARDVGLIPVLGFPWQGKWQATPVFLPGKSHGRRSLVSYSPWGWQKSRAELSNWKMTMYVRCQLPFPSLPEKNETFRTEGWSALESRNKNSSGGIFHFPFSMIHWFLLWKKKLISYLACGFSPQRFRSQSVGRLVHKWFFFFLQSEGKQRMEYSLMSSPDGKSGFKAVMSELPGVK